jgi:hypothetical protein
LSLIDDTRRQQTLPLSLHWVVINSSQDLRLPICNWTTIPLVLPFSGNLLAKRIVSLRKTASGTLQLEPSFFGTIRCWNCDGPHNVQECPEAIDNDRVDRNRAAYKDKVARNGGSRQRKPRNKRPWIWRPPSDEEGGKRIVFDHPHTWNETTRRWDKDATPESGLVPPSAQVGTPSSVCPPGQNCPPITSDVDDATIMTASTTQELVTMQLEMANLVQSLNRFHIP